MNFYNLLFAMGIGACCFPTENVQMFDELPVELVIIILSYSDVKSLVIMSQVNKRLFQICKNNKDLRTKIRRYLRKEKKDLLKKMLNPVRVRVLRPEPENRNTTDAFQNRNARRQTVVARVFDLPQTLPTVNQGAKNVSKKRKLVNQEKKPGLSKRFRI